MSDVRLPYIVRLRVTPLVISAVVCGLFVVFLVGITIAVVRDPSVEVMDVVVALAIVLPFLAFFGALTMSSLTSLLGDRIAVKIDHKGIVLGRLPAHLRVPRQVMVPWAGIEVILLFTVIVPAGGGIIGGSMRCIGLRLRPGVAPPSGEPKQNSIWHPLSRVMDKPPTDICRPIIKLSRFDPDQLVAAVNAHAPRVRVINLG